MAAPGRRLFIVDTDAGVDDAQAIMMFLARPDIKLLALTTVRGNTNAEQVTKNVLRLLKLAGRLDVRACLYRLLISLLLLTGKTVPHGNEKSVQSEIKITY